MSGLAGVGVVVLQLVAIGALAIGVLRLLVRLGVPRAAAARHRTGALMLAGLVAVAGMLIAGAARLVAGAGTPMIVSPRHALGGAPELDLLAAVAPWIGLLAGMRVVLAGARLWSAWRHLRRQAGAAGSAPRSWQEALPEAARLIGHRGSLCLRGAPVDSPMVIGWRHPAILVPWSATGATLSHGDRVLVLAHELAHVVRRDWLSTWFIRIAAVPLAPIPGIGWLARQLTAEREAASDDLVVRRVGASRDYVSALIRLEETRPARPSWAIAMRSGSLLHRATRLLMPAPLPGRGARAIGWSLAGLILVLGSATAAVSWALGREVIMVARVADRASITGRDSAGRFTLEFHHGRPVSATLGDVRVPAEALIPHGDSLRVLANGHPALTVRLRRDGISWRNRAVALHP